MYQSYRIDHVVKDGYAVRAILLRPEGRGLMRFPVKPPPLDEFFCTFDTAERAQDLAEMGLSEAAVWGQT
jgi:hypothetical protein